MTLTRTTLIKSLTAIALLGGSTAVLAADTIKIGYVSPQTGALASFGETDK
ncbi:hypothetical protein [Neopusillimonas aromaticivorans]|uniref:hypothetical protein n=1 Tax=Neopusillimonas aromaticivorans TaxID=2979868 RepID=UPI0025994537|nr:hypothetical protein [Neopusillimonas aromaticivorans]WJJ94092.1 hypothetical protein N7E01_02745 [Neopusillimonas aromaticivorans]